MWNGKCKIFLCNLFVHLNFRMNTIFLSISKVGKMYHHKSLIEIIYIEMECSKICHCYQKKSTDIRVILWLSGFRIQCYHYSSCGLGTSACHRCGQTRKKEKYWRRNLGFLPECDFPIVLLCNNLCIILVSVLSVQGAQRFQL